MVIYRKGNKNSTLSGGESKIKQMTTADTAFSRE